MKLKYGTDEKEPSNTFGVLKDIRATALTKAVRINISLYFF